MSSVKFVHVMKRIEALERDISEIHSLAHEIKMDREYSTPVRISLEQQVNNLLNEKNKLMEVRVENAPDYLNPQKRKPVNVQVEQRSSTFSFDSIEREYYEELRHKRSNYSKETIAIHENMKTDTFVTAKELKGLPSLAEKSLVKPDEAEKDDEKTFLKRREDILKNLPPLEY